MMIMNTTVAAMTSMMELPVSSLKSSVAPSQSLRGIHYAVVRYESKLKVRQNTGGRHLPLDTGRLTDTGCSDCIICTSRRDVSVCCCRKIFSNHVR